MLRPLMIVGVGGSGGKTVRRMRQSLQRQLRRVEGWSGEVPRAWQLVWIDMPTTQAADGDSSPLLPMADYLGLWPKGVPSWPSGLYKALPDSLQPGTQPEVLSGWFDRTIPFSEAAGGQARAAGRNMGATAMSDMRAKLEAWHSTMVSDSAMGELGVLERCLGMNSQGVKPQPMTFVISSLAGGTGAGLFMEVLTALHAVDDLYTSPTTTATLLYTPDIFGTINPALVEQVAANGLASAMEVSSGVFSNGRTQRSMDMLKSQGILVADNQKFSFTYNFLIGRTNTAGVSFEDQNDVYQAMGECLSSLALDDNMLDDLIKFPLLAAFTMGAFGDSTRMKNEADPSQTYPFSGLGLAKVTLGTDRLGDFAAQLLTRDIAEQLMWPEYIPDEGEKIPQQERIERSAADNFPRFLQMSGVNEINPANDVVVALAGDGPVVQPNQPFDLIYSRAEVTNSSAWAQGMVSLAAADAMSGAEWQQTVETYWNTRLAAPLAEAEGDLWAQAQRWTRTIQDQITDLVAESCVEVGIRVTQELLAKLTEEINTAKAELEAESAELGHWSSGQLMEAKRQLSVGKAKMTASDGAVQEAVASIQNGLLFACAAKRQSLAAELVGDLSQNFLAPLNAALDNWLVRLSSALGSKNLPNGMPNPFKVMPQYGRPTPTQFHPGPVEKMLIAVESFEKELTDAVVAGLPSEHKGSWKQLLRKRAGLGLDLATGEGQQMLFYRASDWVPTNSNASAIQGAPSRPEFTMPLTHTAILEGAEEWTGIEKWLASDLAAEVGRLLKIDLHTYVNSGDAQTRLKREQGMISAFTEATMAAAPLVSINSSVATLVHGRDGRDYTSILSSIPFPEGDPLYEPLKNLLVTSGLAEQGSAGKYFKNAAVDSITFLTSSANAMQSVVFDNVMSPAASDWMKRRNNADLRKIFWRWRRARPLAEALPFGREDILPRLIKGWFVADILGQRRTSFDRESDMGPKCEIWCGSDGWQAFPYPLLARPQLPLPRPSRRSIEKPEYLAGVLESYPLALLEVYNDTSLAPLLPYHRLLDLGKDVQNEIGDWIDEAFPAPPLAESAAGTSEQNPEERAKSVEERVLALKVSWEEHLEQYRTHDKYDAHTIPSSFEIAEDVMQVLDDLLTASRA